MIIHKAFSFEASHVLPRHEGKCARLHGHSWKMVVSVEGPVNKETGFVMDYARLKKIVDEHVIEKLDHTHLGYGGADTGLLWVPYFGEKFYPSSENLSRAIFKVLSPFLEGANGVRLYSIQIDETCTSSAVWRREDEHFSTHHSSAD